MNSGLRFKQYMFIPIDLNTASDDDLLSIPGAGPRMMREFKEYRPCHKSAGRPYLRPTLPQASSQSMINYDPAATWPQ